MPTLGIEDYENVARQWRHIASLVQQATHETDLLRVAIPQQLARGMAELLLFGDQVAEIGRRRIAAAGEVRDDHA